jgi:hypothetical protein
MASLTQLFQDIGAVTTTMALLLPLTRRALEEVLVEPEIAILPVLA